ncbi:MAG: sulfurtransferase [Caldilineaceae bacterium]|nr:sulfurtransferase [Caldilineaceae bacterium]
MTISNRATQPNTAQTRVPQPGGPRICTLPGLLVSPDWLAEHLDAVDLRLVDMRSAEEYAESHLPNAVHLDMDALAQEEAGVPGMLIGHTAYAAIMGQLGIDGGAAVILYDSNWGMAAARALWTLHRYGHTNSAVLDGGWDRWQEEERPAGSTPHVPQTTTFVPRPDETRLATLAWVQTHLDDPGVVLVDTRTPGEYAQGHLPGAINWDWMNGVPAGSWNTLRPLAELYSDLTAHGITPDKEIVTYCRSGARASHTYLLLRRLGYPRVRNYDGSWLEWSARVLGIDAHG